MPDADMLVRLADLFEVSVPMLLGAAPEEADEASKHTKSAPPDMREIAEQLSRINEQMVVKNRRSKRVWKIVGIAVLSWILFWLIITVLTVGAFGALTFNGPAVVETSTSISEYPDSAYDALPIP